jgi:hypothetical protein
VGGGGKSTLQMPPSDGEMKFHCNEVIGPHLASCVICGFVVNYACADTDRRIRGANWISFNSYTHLYGNYMYHVL